MKKYLLPLFFICLLSIKCNKDTFNYQYTENDRTTEITRSQDSDTPIASDIEKLLYLGLDTTDLLIRNDYYIADGVCVPKNILDTIPLQNRISQLSFISRHFYKIYYKINTSGHQSLTQCFIDGLCEFKTFSSDSGLDIMYGTTDHTDKSYFPVNLKISNDYTSEDPLVFPVVDALYDAPYQNVIINKKNPLWSQISSNTLQFTYMVMHAVGESLKFDSINYYNESDRSIMMSEHLLATYPDLWNGLSQNDINCICEIFPKIAETNFSFSWEPSLPHNVLQKNTEYTLTISSDNDCCLSPGTGFNIDIMKNGVSALNVSKSHINGTDSFLISFGEAGNYTLSAWVNDGNVQKLHKQTIELSVAENNITFENPDSVIELNIPYTFTYEYYQPNHTNITYEFSVEEAMFGEPIECNMQINGNTLILTPLEYGCYYIDAIVKSNGEEVARKCCNLTILNDMGTDVRMIYDTDASSATPASMDNTYVRHFYYDIHQERPNGNNARTAYFFEYETETQQWNVDLARIVCRNWFLDYNLITFEEGETEKRSTLEMVQHGNMIGYRDAYYQSYTGNIYCPVNGLRFVENKNALSLPMHRIAMRIKNKNDTSQVARPELDIVSYDYVDIDND